MLKRFKYAILALAGITVITLGLVFLLKLKKQEVYLPSGYTITKDSEMRESDIGEIYETLLIKKDKSIQIIKTNKYPHQCEGIKKQMAGIGVCYFDFGENPHLPKDLKGVSWNSGSYDYQLLTNDSSLDEKELTKLIRSFL